MIKPAHLQPGDTIGIVAPASPPADRQSLERGIAALERLGFRTKLAPRARRRWGFLAGTDRERAGDLMSMFADSRIHAILCLRGGYGAGRLLPLLDYQVIRANPKIFVGSSDITALHCAFEAKANLVSFHGPMLSPDFAREELSEFGVRSFLRTLVRPVPPGSVCQGLHPKTSSILRRGTVSGRLVGGNLSVLCTTLGTPFQPSFRNKILFFEEVQEAPYRIDRMLTHLLNAGLLQRVAGVAVGINRNCVDPKASQTSEYRQTVEDVLKERLRRLEVPVVIGLPFGHIPHNAILPLGVRATLDAVKGDLVLTEPAVE